MGASLRPFPALPQSPTGQALWARRCNCPVAHPCNLPLKLSRVEVPDSKPFLLHHRKFHERPGIPAARLPITRFEHSVLMTLPDHQGVVQP